MKIQDIAVTAVIAAGLLAGAAQAQPRPRPGPPPMPPWASDLPKLYPAAAAAWRRELPEPVRSVRWLADFDGTATPIRTVTVAGKPMLYGSVCKVHDCAPNNVAVLFSPDQRRVVGVATITTEEARERGQPVRYTSTLLVGEPTAAEASCLNRFVGIKVDWAPRDQRCN